MNFVDYITLHFENGFFVYLSLTRHIYCSRLEGIKSELLNTLARLSSKDFFLRKTSLTPAACSLHPLKGVYTPFSRGPFGTCPAFNRSHIGDICVPCGTHSLLEALLRIFGCALLAAYTVHASAEQMEPPCHILFGDICVPYGTHHSCSRPLLSPTSSRRRGCSHLSLRFYISKQCKCK